MKGTGLGYYILGCYAANLIKHNPHKVMNRILWLTLVISLVTGCTAPQAPDRDKVTQELTIACTMSRTEFAIGEGLPAPQITITNHTEDDVELVAPTMTVITCTLIPPDKTGVPMQIAMPTGRSPYELPRQALEAHTRVDFAPGDIWFYKDGVGYEPYYFVHKGAHEFYCQYEDLTSNTISLLVE